MIEAAPDFSHQGPSRRMPQRALSRSDDGKISREERAMQGFKRRAGNMSSVRTAPERGSQGRKTA